MTRHGLTKQQSEALTFIRGFTEEYGFAPSYQEVADSLGLTSKSSVHRLVESLTERGFVRRLPSKARSIVVVQ